MKRRAVGIIILFKNREILLARRGSKEKRESGKWESVGGELRKEESWSDAVERELKEEIGEENLKNLSMNKKAILHWTDTAGESEDDDWEAKIFLAQARRKFTVTIDKDEDGFIDDVKWFEVSNLPLRNVATYCLEDFRRLKVSGTYPFSILKLESKAE